MKHTLPPDDVIYGRIAWECVTKADLLTWASRRTGRRLSRHALRNALMRLEARELIGRRQSTFDRRVVIYYAMEPST